MELAIAFRVAPLTPFDNLRPIKSEATSNPDADLHITRQLTVIMANGANIPAIAVISP